MSKNAFSREQAVEVRKSLVAAGLSQENVRIRNRSWDNEGLWFAVDVKEPGKDEPTKLYNQYAVDAYLAQLKPIDVTPYAISTRFGTISIYQFRSDEAGYGPLSFLRSKDGSYWWTEADIKACGGRVTKDGKTYRLGKQEF